MKVRKSARERVELNMRTSPKRVRRRIMPGALRWRGAIRGVIIYDEAVTNVREAVELWG